jgi:hypothetical protein
LPIQAVTYFHEEKEKVSKITESDLESENVLGGTGISYNSLRPFAHNHRITTFTRVWRLCQECEISNMKCYRFSLAYKLMYSHSGWWVREREGVGCIYRSRFCDTFNVLYKKIGIVP